MRRTLSSLRAESDAEDLPVRARLDWLFAAAVLATATAEAVARHDVVWSSVAIVVGLTLASTMLWRRTRPLAMVALGFGALAMTDLAAMFADARPIPLYTGAVVVVLAYALFRWGTRRQVTIGAGIVLVAWVVSVTTDFTGLADAIGGLVVLLFVGALGAAIRYRRIVSTQQLEWVRSHERETLARELHDTVAHHVSAIAIRPKPDSCSPSRPIWMGLPGPLRLSSRRRHGPWPRCGRGRAFPGSAGVGHEQPAARSARDAGVFLSPVTPNPCAWTSSTTASEH